MRRGCLGTNGGRPLLLVGLFILLAPHSLLYSEASESDEEELSRALRDLEGRLRQRRSAIQRRFPEQSIDEVPNYSDEWVVQVEGGPEKAEEVASNSGYQLVGPVMNSDDHYVLRKRSDEGGNGISKRGLQPHLTKRLADEEAVKWVRQQEIKRRVKRDRNPLDFNDELWDKQWYLHDTRTATNLPKLDLHVVGAWKMGYTGKGVVVTILDDGLQHDHPDLSANYDPKASYDLNDNDTDPMPTMNDFNKHGTRCAGEVSMVANNHICGVGVAFNSYIGGIRMLDGKITDRLESEALSFNLDHVDVFSASWGPNDDGKTVEGPGTLAEKALIKGITTGRGGKGTIYVWASGNGGTYQDDCDCDGYTDSVYTLSVSSASQTGLFPWYGEKCSSTIATTYSSGAYTDQKITTTDLKSKCTTEHTGTSASAPLAAGIVALGLEANPSLTWRDVQHITIWTSEPAPLLKNDGWHKNGLGLWANTRFGFGLMNAEEFVKTAKDWTPVPAQKICTTTFPTFHVKPFKTGEVGTIKFSTDGCQGQSNEINFLEHVQLVTDINYTRRGNLAIYLQSPQGTHTKLLSPRRRDNSKAGFRKWPFMSVHTWGEDPKGWWQLEVVDKDSQSGSDFGKVTNITLILYGTTEKPAHYKHGRQYNMNYNRVHDRSLPSEMEGRIRRLAHGYGSEIVKRSLDHVESEESGGQELDRINRALDLIEQGFEREFISRRRTERSVVYDDGHSR